MLKLALLDLLTGILDIAFLGLMLLIVNYYTRGSTPARYAIWLFRGGKNSLLLITVFLLLFALKNWFAYAIAASGNAFFYRVATRLSKQNVYRYLNDDYIQFTHTDTSLHIRRISQQPIEFSRYILTNMQQVISQGILVLLTIAAILCYQPLLFCLLCLLLLPPVLLLALLMKKKLRQVRLHTRTASEKALRHLHESLWGFVESNVYNKHDFFARRYYDHQELLNNTIARQQSLQGLPPRLIEVFALFGFLILTALNKWAADSPVVDLLTTGVFIAASYKIIPGIVKILNSTGQIKTYEFTLDDLLPGVTAARQTADARPAAISSVNFAGVNFSYQHNQVLNHLTFGLLPGDFAGITGKSGRGKTTLINLMLGFLEPSGGHILINNRISSCTERQQYLSRISYVKQQSFLINDSVAKNVTLCEEAPDAGKLAEVLSFCGIDIMLRQYPEGINKIITENGKNISGGQRQRIALARALYHDFDLLVLDEPFSEMDATSEAALLMQLQLLALQGKIIVLITHNQAALAYCNQIIPLHGK